MKRIKSDWRSSLSCETLNRLMFISIQGPTNEDYSAGSALERWWSEGQQQRRPLFQNSVDDDNEETMALTEESLLAFLLGDESTS